MAKFVLTWNNLSYSVYEKHGSSYCCRNQERKKIIIDNVSGTAFSGTVIAILGVSGCGKTTLLTLLSGQRKGKGSLRLNGRVISDKMLRSNSTFMQQKDIFIESLTVQEHLNFVAAMCLNKSHKARLITVNNLLKDVNIEPLRCQKIEQLSSGEKRKLSLASNLLLEPYIMFCDEPTTGLDSFSAVSLINILQNVAMTGKIVFLTVHQPSSHLFDMFDTIILLSTNGKVVFQGSKQNAISFFESQSLICPPSYNPADFFINCIIEQSKFGKNKIDKMIEKFNTDYCLKLQFSEHDYTGLLLRKRQCQNNFFFVLAWMIWRIMIGMARDLRQYVISFSLTLLTALIIGLTFSSTQITDSSSVQNIQGALLLIVSELIFYQMYNVIYIFPGEIDIYIREKTLYEPLPYFLSKILSLLPFCIVHTFGFLIIYFACLPFLGGIELFWQMYAILFGASLGGSALGLCLSALFPSIESIHLFIVPLELICLLLSGLWIKITTLSNVFAVIKYFSPFYVSFESICITFWLKADRISKCHSIKNETNLCTGTEVLAHYGLNSEYTKVLNNYLYLIILILVYCYIGYIGILRKRALYHV
ncbi:protein scarlet-like [Anthonomus grandis grandis]|uniref:protein scarlet-like n=1 Tax=Anthonomus grandis grandis TaxID=2921223 RepID=UPI002165B6EF|nr:protein scarlet-like [Anthonomus grandis grandis]